MTNAISFGIVLDPGFTYQLRRVSTSVNDNTFAARDCNDGSALADEFSDVPNLALTSYEVRGLSPYTRYGLCYRAANDAGASEWKFTANGVLTLPAAPSAPSAAVSSIAHDASPRNAVWNVATSGNARVPRGHEAYEVKVLSMRSVNPDDPDDDGTRKLPDLSIADCRAATLPSGKTSAPVEAGLSNTQSGFRVTSPVPVPGVPDDSDPNKDQDYRVCVRAHLGGSHTGNDAERAGPWVIGSLVVAKDPPASN